MVEFSDFPPEIHQMIVERCDFFSRFQLRSTSKSMMQIVDSSKFYIWELRVNVDEGSIILKARFISDGKTFSNKKTIEDLNSMEITAKWMGNILKNAEIGVFNMLDNSPLTGQFLQKLIANLKSPLKVGKIVWIAKPFSNFFDKKFLEEVDFFKGDKSDFTGDFLEILKDLEKVSVFFPIDVTDEYVLSMNSTNIHLQSDNLTAEMVNRLLDKFIARGTINCYFSITNKKEDFRGKIGIPEGFVRHPDNPKRYQKPGDGKKMDLSINNGRVFFGISEVKK